MRRFTKPARTAGAAFLVAACASMGAFGGTPGAQALSDKDLPSSMHGAVETQAITVGNGALSLLVDPGTAYAYSTLDRDDYGGGSTNYTMTARGANANLGTIAYAVVWAAPDCTTNNVPCVTSGQWMYKPVDDSGQPYYQGAPLNTGLHEAKGWPFYAEALYPPPPEGQGASQERVYKCVLTKDGPGSPPTQGAAGDVCHQSDSIPMTAWAETIADEYRSTGYSRAEGFDLPGLLAVHGSESHSEVRAIGGGLVRSTGSSNVSGIDILGGLIHLDNVYSTATVVSGSNGVDATQSTASCTFAGLTVNGVHYGNAGDFANQSLQQQLDAVAKATGYQVQMFDPQATKLQQIDGGKFASGCQGFQFKFTDLHTGPPTPPGVPELCVPAAPAGVPPCVPALGNREEWSFGKILVQQSVTDLGDLIGGDQGLPAGGGDFNSVSSTASSAASGAAAAGTGAGSDVAGAGAGLGSGSVATPPTGTGRTGRASGRTGGYSVDTGGGSAFHPRTIGALTAASGLGVLLGTMVLIGVVNALASGRPFRFPGF